jgi:hypothetical protein
MHRIKPPYRINPANQFAYVHYSFPLFSEYRSELLESPRSGFSDTPSVRNSVRFCAPDSGNSFLPRRRLSPRARRQDFTVEKAVKSCA